MNGLVGLEGLTGFRDLINLFFAAMMGWVHSLSNWVWTMIGGGGLSGGSWFASNWLRLLIVLVVAGLVMDWLVWMLRWQPYRLWFKSFRRRSHLAAVPAYPVEYAGVPVETPDAAPEQTYDLGYEQPYEQPLAEPSEPLYEPVESFYEPAEPPAEYADDLIAEPIIEEEPIESDYANIDEAQPDLMFEVSDELEPVSRWPWNRFGRNPGVERVRTVTGRLAQRRGLFRLASDDDEAIAGLPPMMSRDDGYNQPTLPPQGSLADAEVDPQGFPL
ncbi:hypothetical protein AGMMS49992_06120 [Clostridia bacterium]|nr:hypothetical protein AGMMS49992_06120 [Clostridia bacterium]